MRSILNEKNLYGKKILLRLDLNVPLENGKITDTTRIDKILPTLNFLIKQKAIIVILSHIGRPKGKVLKKLSLKPIGEDLRKKLNLSVKLITENIYEIKNKEFFKKFNEKILILENIRFYEEEEKNDEKFAHHLASLGDLYVNDAFSCSHRKHASIHQISKYLPSFSGLQLDLEVAALNKITNEITKPITCIIGGSKISTKIDVIKNLIPKFDNIIIVGGMANNFIEYFGNNIGKSIKEKNCNHVVEQIISLSKNKGCKIIYPEDVLVSKNLNGSSKNKKGSAGKNGPAINFSEKVVKALRNKVKEHNAKHSKKVTLGQLKKVYRRGAGAFSQSHRPNMSRGGWAMARVNMFLKMKRGGKVKDSYRKADGDI